jgi:hypothetical protein
MWVAHINYQGKELRFAIFFIPAMDDQIENTAKQILNRLIEAL